jgi:hypothetical protein
MLRRAMGHPTLSVILRLANIPIDQSLTIEQMDHRIGIFEDILESEAARVTDLIMPAILGFLHGKFVEQATRLRSLVVINPSFLDGLRSSN